MQFDDLYKEIIQDHYRHPRNKQALSDKDQGAVLDNPSCGDRVALKIVWDEEERISSISFDGEGCSISMASASMMTELLSGKTREEALATALEIHKVFRGEEPGENLEPFGDIVSLQGLVQYPVRLKCATLAWQTLDLLLNKEKL
ncbi:SUF system NifU family Fe-S cluster assembly protein [Oceanispirochaeta crateris]|jgi:nitrogen fixation NifU-like protein|uniref:SUF system NifU family Fe-S cluster assembly protein n=1 Tax=Oceanispirochaeta crateris TaxID=2518645 RepID=A0A5C1QQE1_9SPIO|nr:SUF system NifU family Fe-S cluster assembly protein [Oceanispirochaeta crateris]QEN08834.1 SUF system NifU family Fe-S cluster assembly protein [Oceanispirochaeta crateris]